MKRSMNWKIPFATVVSALSLSVVAAPLGSDIGQNPDPSPQEKLERAKDANNAVFSALDRNRDDQLDKDEAQIERTLRHDFDDVDTNADGVVSREEFIAQRKSGSEDFEEAE